MHYKVKIRLNRMINIFSHLKEIEDDFMQASLRPEISFPTYQLNSNRVVYYKEHNCGKSMSAHIRTNSR